MKYLKFINSRIFFVAVFVFIVSCGVSSSQWTDRKAYYVLSDGARIPVYENGLNTEKIILFTHGGPGFSGVIYYHMPFFKKLAQSYKVIFWDQRGSGGSRGHIDKSSITLPQFVKDMDVVYQSIQVRYPKSKIYIMGHSFGGLIGGAFVSRFNNKVPASIFVAPAFNVEQMTKTISPLMINWIQDYLNSPNINEQMRSFWTAQLNFYQQNPILGVDQFNRHLSNTSAVDMVDGNTEPIDYVKEAVFKDFVSDNILDSLDFFQQSFRVLTALGDNGEGSRNLSTDVQYGLAGITTPMLLFTGGSDFVVPKETSIDGYNKLNNGTPNPKSQQICFVKAPHQPFFRFESEMLQAIDLFLQKN
ncbi:MAG: alpha/beta fold hydrolase [Brevinemataceae bacterium]